MGASEKPGLRPYLPEDAQIAAAIFVAAIEQLTDDDYSEAQQEAWSAVADDDAKFAARLASQLTLIATLGGAPVGFASLKGADHIDMLYVHPDFTRMGVATSLIDALEKIVGARGVQALTVDASDNAAEFFTRRAYVATRRNTVTINGEWLANTSMKKTLADPAAPGADQ
ncbi:GNAT family N-acetyltransferase [Rhodopseudomonas sp. HC1]|uniref:GNAT family N-acetyltransferase n=1 Tax=Rhodopseudomonas infernalis TaxID=2897386 RepID=UPI001EE8D2BD|nr:GNAT family N-acetyltransferase [Rhodopseudomonas infernalis]MCG6203037.1 GNAT family N-acetyltransferase [Rhodopseudomonas infernalis]